MIDRLECNEIVNFTRYWGKINFEIQRDFNINTKLGAFYKIHCRSLFFDIKKRRQYSEIRAIC